MRTWLKPGLAIAGAALGIFLQVAPTHAQATRTWVSGVGDDANPCSRTAPCKTFAGAISKTAAGGQINVLDPGAYGALTITKSITVDASGNFAGVLATLGSSGIIVNALSTDIVVLRGLTIDGHGTGANGIRFLAGGTLNVQDCVIRNFRAASPNGFGIAFLPSGASKLNVWNTVIENNGTGSTGGGVQIKPSGTGSARGSFDQVQILGNTVGFQGDGTGNSGGMLITLRDSMVASNSATGVLSFVPAGGGVTHINLDRTTVVNNAGTGVIADGTVAVVRLNGTTISGNNLGLAFLNSGSLVSFSNNQITGNISGDGAPTTTLPGLR